VEFYYHDVDKDVLILRADGRIDGSTGEEFVGNLQRLVEAGARKTIIDCSGLGHISSSGVGVLMRLHRKLWAVGGDVKVAAVSGTAFHLLELTKLAELFDIYPTVDAALEAFRKAAGQ
jgi:anti-sigma B factor antagonist